MGQLYKASAKVGIKQIVTNWAKKLFFFCWLWMPLFTSFVTIVPNFFSIPPL
jgi:hypothetical protein